MLTPWFAVSVGIVIASALSIARPHPALTFPKSVPGRCVQVSCADPATGPSVPRPAIKQRVMLPRERQQARVRPAAATVSYKLLSSHGSRFIAVILIVSRHALGRWQLTFSLPQTSINDIMWAKWRSHGQSDVFVTGSPAPWAYSTDKSAADEARIIVIGTGSPGWPTGCRFDGATCSFHGMPGTGGRWDRGDMPSELARPPFR